jgi:hypothetical protein
MIAALTRLFPVTAVTLALGSPVLAQSAADDLIAAMRLDEVIGIMRDEGLAYGAEVGASMFGGAVPSDWTMAVDAIYDAERMEAELRAALDARLAGVDVGPMVAFFTTEPGATFVELEISGRRALLDDEVEQAAKEAAAVAMADETPLYDLVRRYVVANDLVETNVIAAMNANVAFYIGLMEGGAPMNGLTEDQILSDVWSQEPEIRSSTTEWVYSLLLMAYSPASEADLEAYIAFSEGEAGQILNDALFDAFGPTFEGISRALGQASAGFMATSEL